MPRLSVQLLNAAVSKFYSTYCLEQLFFGFECTVGSEALQVIYQMTKIVTPYCEKHSAY